MSGLPWTEINVALFRIDAVHSNAYTAAGGSETNPFPVPDPARLAAIRRAQELAVARPIAHGIAVLDGTYRETLSLEPYATLCLWITPLSATVPAAPAWLEVIHESTGTVLRWEPTEDPSIYGYELFSMEDGLTGGRLTPDPLRAALWVDTTPPPGRRYAVRAVSASGVASPLIVAT